MPLKMADSGAIFLLSIVLSLAMAMLCVAVHYEGLNLLERLSIAERRFIRRRRHRMLLLMLGVVGLHIAEVWMFALVYAGLHASVPAVGSLAWNSPLPFPPEDFSSHLYFSGVCYTSLGMGDLIPTGILRMLSVSEALIGLVLIGWSVSFTFLMMQRLWGDRSHP